MEGSAEKRAHGPFKVFMPLIAAVSLLLMALPARMPAATAAGPKLRALAGYVPALVASGRAQVLGRHNPNDVLRLTFSLQLRNPSALQRFLQALDDPASPGYHRFLTQQQFDQQFAPTATQDAAVAQWLRAGGLTVLRTYPNHLLVDVHGQTAQIERLLHIVIDDYRAPAGGVARTFFGPATNPIVPAPLNAVVQSITGLDSFPHIVPFRNGTAHGKAPYFPQDLANAYNVNPLWNAGYTGSGQHIGIVLWTVPPSDSTLQHFKSKTGADVATVANGRLKVIPVDGGTSTPDEGEAAMDIEYSSGLAPGATINYYEAPTTITKRRRTAKVMRPSRAWRTRSTSPARTGTGTSRSITAGGL